MNNQKILIVDDQTINLKLITVILEKTKVGLTTALSGVEEILDQDPDYDLILMDVQMPVMNGFETVREIKKIPVLQEIPIIFITAYKSNEEFVNEGYSLGAYDYISKPFPSEILINKVKIFFSITETKAPVAKSSRRIILFKQKFKTIE